MALPTVADLKRVLRIESSVEDTLLAALLASGEAAVRGELGRDIGVTERTFIDEAETSRVYGVVRHLVIPPQYLPIEFDADSSQSTDPVVEDTDGTVLDPDVDYRIGMVWESFIRARPGITFTNPPYTVTVHCGLAADPEYATRIEPAIKQAILDAASDLYHFRSPSASSETTGGGVSQSRGEWGLPARVCALLSPWKVIRVP
jgi:hypothetical protein